jgi:hypothetical protein
MAGGKGEEISEKELTAWEAKKKEGEDRPSSKSLWETPLEKNGQWRLKTWGKNWERHDGYASQKMTR